MRLSHLLSSFGLLLFIWSFVFLYSIYLPSKNSLHHDTEWHPVSLESNPEEMTPPTPQNQKKLQSIRLQSQVHEGSLDHGLLSRSEDSIEILLWEGSNWAGFGKLPKEKLQIPNFLGAEVSRSCPVSCDFTVDRSRAPFVDAVLFEAPTYGVDIANLTKKGTLRFPHKRTWQKWVDFSYETPQYFPLQEHRMWKENMDIFMNYNQEEGAHQVPITLTCMWGGGNLTDLRLPPPPHSETSPIVFMNSNCAFGGAKKRTEFVGELMKYLPVDSYGKCLHNKELPVDMQGKIYKNHGKAMKDKISLFQKYKFALVFENTQLKDYVSEKLMCALQAGTVPIYLGAENIDEWTPGNHSLINAKDFPSAKNVDIHFGYFSRSTKALAEYLQFLLDHPEEYNKYFHWKQEEFSSSFLQKFERCLFYGGECRLCQHLSQLRQTLPRQPTHPLHALSFDRTGTVEISSENFPHESVESHFTVGGWIQAFSFRDYRILDKNSPKAFDGFKFQVVGSGDKTYGHLQFCYGETCKTGTKKLFPSQWYFVSLTFSLSEGLLIFYIDGEIDSIHSINSAVPINPLPLCIGSSSHFVGGWDGSLDEIFISTKVLSQQDIRSLLFNKMKGDEDGLIGYWDFDEGKGSVIRDKSLSNAHGKLIGAVSFFRSESKPVHLTSPLPL